MKHETRTRRAGFTVVETLIAISVMVIVLGGVVTATLRGQGAFKQSVANSTVDSMTARTVSRVARELAGAAVDSLDLAHGDSDDVIEYRLVEGYDEGKVLGDVVRLRFELASGELDNGVDDNGNGLVDEGVVVRIQSPGEVDERRSILVHGVRRLLEGEERDAEDNNGNGLADESGFYVERSRDVLGFGLTIERPGPGRRNVTRTLVSSVTLRN